MAIFHEIKSGRKIKDARGHIKNKIKSTEALNGIVLTGLPKSAKMYLILLRMHLYSVALIGAKIISKKRG